jgi:hypothetical protein
MTLFVAVDVACLECGGGELETRVLGVYKSREQAEAQFERSRRATESRWASYDFTVCESDVEDER